MKYFINISTATLLLILLFAAGCKKFLEVEVPITREAAENVFEDDNTAIAALTYLYGDLSDNWLGDNERLSSTSLYTELLADNLVHFNTANRNMMAYYQNDLGPDPTDVCPPYWGNVYNKIYSVNAAVEGIARSQGMSQTVKDALMGEAKFMRAFYYFHLVNFYGGVPLVLTTDYTATLSLSRSTKEQVYEQIVDDLLDAKRLMKPEFMDNTLLSSSPERIRPCKWTAVALLARVYLYTGEYELAEAEATEVINQTGLFEILPLNEVFVKNSRETLWSLQTVPTFQNTWQGRAFPLFSGVGPEGLTPYYLQENLIEAFPEEDGRLQHWIDSVHANGAGYYFAYKYKVGLIENSTLEYDIVFRLAEQFLIRAEARAEQGKLTGSNSASSDLSVIRQRAGLPAVSIASEPAMMDSIVLERRRELFTEWGHRWFDLRRTGRIDAVMTAIETVKGGTWEPYKALFPVPVNQLEKNPGMKDQQTPGY